MAILESKPHIEVRVLIEGRPATEYESKGSEHIAPPAANNDQQLSPNNTVVKYIESVSDTTFEVHFNAYYGYPWARPCLAFLVEIDGHFVSGMTFNNLDPAPGSIKGWRKISPTGRWTLLGFRFVGFTTSEAANVERVKAEKGHAEEMGTIELANRFLYYDDLNRPMVRYIFRHRSKEALQHLSIIPGPDYRYPEENHAYRQQPWSIELEAEQEINARLLDQNAVIDLTANQDVELLAFKREAKQERYAQELDQAIIVDLTEDDDVNLRGMKREIINIEDERSIFD